MGLPMHDNIRDAPKIGNFKLVEASVNGKNRCNNGFEAFCGAEPRSPDYDASNDDDQGVFHDFCIEFGFIIAIMIKSDSDEC